MHQNNILQEKIAVIYEITKKTYFADLFPYGVMGDQQGLIDDNQHSLKGWVLKHFYNRQHKTKFWGNHL